MRVIALTAALLAAGSLPAVALAAPPAGSYRIEVSEPGSFPMGRSIDLVQEPIWGACAYGKDYLVCLEGQLSSDPFGTIHADEAVAKLFAADSEQSSSSFPIEVTGNVSGTPTDSRARLRARGEGSVNAGSLVGTGKAVLRARCRASANGSFGCNTVTLSFCFQPEVGRRDCTGGPELGTSFRGQRSSWTLTFRVTTDARDAITGSGALDLAGTGDHVDLVVTGKYDPKRDLASFRFTSTPQPGVTLWIRNFDEATQPTSGRLEFVVGGAHGSLDLSQLSVGYTP